MLRTLKVGKFINYFTPCINFLMTGFKAIITNPAVAGTIVNIKKNVDKEYCSVILSICPPNNAANLFPMAIAKYHIPNINAIILEGTNLLT
jgi:hypothetical protein